ncbi:MAG: HigA family addiction module antitoxin [Verrucomicrobium sp.]|nr:HigA family addiction module antitoxin [Verrucomicrobium sp.]
MKMKMLPHPTPGETLRQDFMEPLGLKPYGLAKALGVGQTAVGEILAGTRAISTEMALRLEAVTGSSAQFWLALQCACDLAVARENPVLKAKIGEIHRLRTA